MSNAGLSTANRPREWRDTSNSEAVIISDRAKKNSTILNVKSVHTNPTTGTNEWRGSVGFNDNHVTFEATHNQLDTQYADVSTTNDNLFDVISQHEATLVATQDGSTVNGEVMYD